MDPSFPGYLGWTSKGVVAIHADWPAYPWEHGWEEALLTLGEFPVGTKFRCQENIDRCCLFVADEIPGQYSFRRGTKFHIAIWIDDIVELGEMQLVDGVKFEYDLSPDQIHMKRQVGPEFYEQVQNGLRIGYMIDGQFRESRTVATEGEYDYGFDLLEVGYLNAADHLAIFEGDEITLRSDAEARLDRLAQSRLYIPPSLQDRILALLGAGLFDSAIRDLGAALERQMRTTTHSRLYGHQLVDHYIEFVNASGVMISSHLKTLHTNLKTGMTFVRNEFAHDLVALEPPRGSSLVSRMCRLVTALEEIADALAEHGRT
jgi:hypothetical protein